MGVERITANGLLAGGVHTPVDCIVYASGFEVGTRHARRAVFDLVGRGGTRLSAHRAGGIRSLHGMFVHVFPNAFFVQPTQGANLISNVPHNLSEAGRTIAQVISHALSQGQCTVEVTREAEDARIALRLSGPGRMIGGQDCTPGYYNNEGQDTGLAGQLAVGHPAGPAAYFKYLDGWRSDGRFDGLEFGQPRRAGTASGGSATGWA